jgi:hypothetical protein
MIKYLRIFLVFSTCAGMANVVDEVLDRYNRPFTLLAIGKETGLVVAKMASSHPESTFIILDQTPGNENALSSQANTIWMNHKPLFSELQNLASCEHVDVLLLSNSLPMFYPNWNEALQVFQQMAHVVIVQLPKQQTDLLNYLSQLPNGEAYEEASSISYVLEGKNLFRLAKTTLIHPRKRRWSYEIYCDYNQKYLKKIRPNWTATNPWLPGINMMTFLIYNGAIPSRSQILTHLPIDQEHSDWVPNNMIVQGDHILLIDKGDPASTPMVPDGGKRFRDMEAKVRAFISTTANLSPSQVREKFISIYNWGKYFDQIEIEE